MSEILIREKKQRNEKSKQDALLYGKDHDKAMTVSHTPGYAKAEDRIQVEWIDTLATHKTKTPTTSNTTPAMSLATRKLSQPEMRRKNHGKRRP